MAIRKAKCFLLLLCFLFILGCSSDFKDPEKAIRAFYQATFIDKDFKRSYKYISSESQKRSTPDEYQKYYGQNKSSRKIIELSILPDEQGDMKHRRIKVIYETIDDKNKTYKDLSYYTLINENGEWKILWFNILFEAADEQFRKGFYGEAIKQYEEILSIDPYSAGAYYSIGWCYLRKDEDGKAVSNIKKAIAIEPDVPEYYDSIATYYKSKKLYSLAVENTKKAISFEYGSDSHMSGWYGNLSVAYEDQEDYKNALEAVNKAVALNPNNAHALWRKGEILLDMKKDKDIKQGAVEAKEMFLKALETNEKNKEKLEETPLGQIYYRLAIVENFLKDYTNAKKHIMQALEIDPEDKNYQKIYYAIKINE